jgi:uracil-DNA glycosylase
MTEPAPRRPAIADREVYDPDCTRCPRLAGFLADVRQRYPDYWARPVPSFGADDPPIVLVGLAPGMHGANRTSRPFTGDFAGILLYESLHELGLATRPVSLAADDGLELRHTRIVNAVKCLPPENKPRPDEIRRCNAYLRAEVMRLHTVRVYAALGRIAHDALLLALSLKRSAHPFAHGREHPLESGRVLIDSYHCSRYNTQTGRLTPKMFRTVLARARDLARLP